MAQHHTSTGSTAIDDAELRLECARLAAIFSAKGDHIENAQRLYRFIKDGEGT